MDTSGIFLLAALVEEALDVWLGACCAAREVVVGVRADTVLRGITRVATRGGTPSPTKCVSGIGVLGSVAVDVRAVAAAHHLALVGEGGGGVSGKGVGTPRLRF